MGYGNLSQQILLNELPTDERDLFNMISTADPETYQRASDLMYAIQGGNKERGTGSPYSRLREMAYVGQLRGRQDELASQKAEAMQRAMRALQTFNGNQTPMSMEDYMAQTGMNPNDIGEPIVPQEQRQDYLGRWGEEMRSKAGRGETFTNADLLPYELAGVRSKPERPSSRPDVMLQLSQAGVPPEVIKAMLPEPKERKITGHMTQDAQGNVVYADEQGNPTTTRVATVPENPDKIRREQFQHSRTEQDKFITQYLDDIAKIEAENLQPEDRQIAIQKVVDMYKGLINLKDPTGTFIPPQDTDYFTKDLGQSKGTPQTQPQGQPQGQEWIEGGVKYRINPKTGKKQRWVD